MHTQLLLRSLLNQINSTTRARHCLRKSSVSQVSNFGEIGRQIVNRSHLHKLLASLRMICIVMGVWIVGMQSSNAKANAEQGILIALSAEFDMLKLLAFLSIGVGLAIGLALFTYMHKRLLRYDALLGFMSTVFVAPALFTVSTMFLGNDSRVCLTADLKVGVDAVLFDAACATAREGVANLIGLKSLWRIIFGEVFSGGTVSPLNTVIVITLIYISLILAASTLYLAGRQILKQVESSGN